MLRSREWALGWNVARIAVAVLIAAAVLAQFAASVSEAVARGRDVATVIANFFSFFTILSNVSACVVLVLLGIRFLVRRRTTDVDPAPVAAALAWVSTYMITTGVVYNLLLRDLPLQPETVAWSNEVMHVWGPLFLLLDVLIGPNRRRLPWAAAFGAAIFPIAWIIYTLLRAPLITNPTTKAPFWYPYPFLNPETGGWGHVVMYIIVIALAIITLAFVVVAVGRRRGIRST
ncbi:MULTISPECIES: Pr6Pr family membrane protein [Microbacterium]|uniref:Pr6Pr family membrane protein n=1 Tax=Microbacterium TaxID=33882 RepID=UPI0027878318|nr:MULTISPECIES: Pr6Pr family membrane protein [Microbacterium]MDQ1082392.1 putative membrane protein [Microbacterium sp. SORGH_AS_0344]MDQ1168837.1 putative membrane protein [Microbacterium proteolyticum]